MASAQDKKSINDHNSSTHEEQEYHYKNKDSSVSDKNHPRRTRSSSSSSKSEYESDRLDVGKDDDNGSAEQFPSMQVMKRSTDDDGETKNTPKSRTYRLPSYVFARTNTTAPTEWSTASNESLFSIHMGNMSFTRDYLKSGELASPGPDSTFSGPMIDFSSDQPPTPIASTPPSSDSNNAESNSGGKKATLAASEADGGVSVKKEEEKSEEINNDCTSPTGKEAARPSISNHSGGSSVKSFAFPILGGADRSGSLSVNPHTKQRKSSKQLQASQPETPKITELQPRRGPKLTETQPDSKMTEPQPQGDQESKAETEPQKVQTPKKTNSARNTNSSNSSKWLSCFSCCATSCG